MTNPRLKEPTLPTGERYNPLGSRAVIGLEGGRKTARRGQRRRRVVDRIVSAFIAAIVLGAVGAAGWFGYQFYQEQETDDLLEQEQRRAETVDPTGDNLRDAVNQLEVQGRWNGPGNPAFGVGEAESDPSPAIVITTQP